MAHHHGGGHHHSSHHHHHSGSHYYGGRRQSSPIQVFNLAFIYRVVAWLWPALLVACIVCIVISQVAGDSDGSLLMGAAITGFFCFGTLMFTTTGCCAVGSAKFIQLPCCISQSEVELIKQDCMMRSPNFMMAAAMVGGMQPAIVVQQPQYMQSPMQYSYTGQQPQQQSQVQPGAPLQLNTISMPMSM
ncbi:Hypothetical_protein [Hexamita inflata]|uniref:Hypothetical_protein n=1 Tax=Hexamita inflata TaxID=28002 RepID=A0ABP1H9I2_9EUKA